MQTREDNQNHNLLTNKAKKNKGTIKIKEIEVCFATSLPSQFVTKQEKGVSIPLTIIFISWWWSWSWGSGKEKNNHILIHTLRHQIPRGSWEETKRDTRQGRGEKVSESGRDWRQRSLTEKGEREKRAKKPWKRRRKPVDATSRRESMSYDWNRT